MINNTSNEYIVTARKWRPLKFSDVIGQEHVTQTLQNSIKMNRHHHAYIFSGPRGVGKTTTARILARALNCEKSENAEPCNECDSCISILEGRSLDVIEIDGASNNSVDDVRKLRENSRFTPVGGKYKMYIIDEVHMLSTSAFNALLKTLEEPPAHLIFVFATTEVHKVPATILSRCQRFDFRRMSIDSIAKQIKFIAEKEQIAVDEDSLVSIARKADGSMRDGQSIFDQVVAFCGKDVTYTQMADALHLIDQDFFFQISDAVKEHDIRKMFLLSAEVNSKGYDLQECLGGLVEHFRNLLTSKIGMPDSFLESSPSFIKKYIQESQYFTKADLLRYLNLISTAEQALRYAAQPKTKFELTLVQLASLDSAVEITELLDEIKNIKQGKIPLTASASVQTPTKKVAEIKASEVSKPEPEKAETIAEKKTENKFKVIQQQELEAGWNCFLQKFATGENGFFTLTQPDIVAPTFFNGEIVLNVVNEFFADKLNNAKSHLHDLLLEHFGSEVGLKIIVNKDAISVNQRVDSSLQHSDSTITTQMQMDTKKENTSETSKQEIEKETDFENKHEIEKTIISLFNAKEIKK
ncbi:MAG: DNA polymerase III subunit gamma/tau [Bacteroidota bacterium]